MTEPPLIVTLRSWPRGERYSFDSVVFDEAADSLHLGYGPPSACSSWTTPEGHFVSVAAPDPYLSGLVITGVSRRLHDDGRIQITIGPTEILELDLADVAMAVSRPGARRTNRFARRSRAEQPH